MLEAIGRHDRDLERQARRACTSVVLNAREGDKQKAGKGRSRFEDAMGSADEVKGSLMAAAAHGYVDEEPALVDGWDRIARTLNKLRR